MADFDHNRIIAQVTQETLRPLGFWRYRRSRLWLADGGWWLLLVEFQPSLGRRGSYLNVGAMWLWRPVAVTRPQLDVFRRNQQIGRGTFVEANDESEFTAAMREAAEIAAREATEWRGRVRDVDAALGLILEPPPGTIRLYADLHAAIAAGLAGRWELARRTIDAFAQQAAGDASLEPMVQPLEWLRAALRQDAFSSAIKTWIETQRSALGLARCEQTARL